LAPNFSGSLIFWIGDILIFVCFFFAAETNFWDNERLVFRAGLCNFEKVALEAFFVELHGKL